MMSWPSEGIAFCVLIVKVRRERVEMKLEFAEMEHDVNDEGENVIDVE